MLRDARAGAQQRAVPLTNSCDGVSVVECVSPAVGALEGVEGLGTCCATKCHPTSTQGAGAGAGAGAGTSAGASAGVDVGQVQVQMWVESGALVEG